MTEELPEVQPDLDWQPARISPASYAESVHNKKAPFFDRTWVRDQGKLIHVMPRSVVPALVIESFREQGCDSEIFVQVHPSEVAGLGYNPGVVLYMCIHQALTD